MGYYAERLHSERLRRCYEIAPPRVAQYLESEIRHLIDRIGPDDEVLELGCGYGRVALELAKSARRVVGIDTAPESLELARTLAGSSSKCEFLQMDAARTAFPDDTFDVTACVQNGICAFGVDPPALVREAVRVTKENGILLFSTYTEAFWPHRLEWFEIQAREGLLGEIDYGETGDGVIVCRDGFRAGAMNAAEFEQICGALGLAADVDVVDGSSLFFEVHKRSRRG